MDMGELMGIERDSWQLESRTQPFLYSQDMNYFNLKLLKFVATHLKPEDLNIKTQGNYSLKIRECDDIERRRILIGHSQLLVRV